MTIRLFTDSDVFDGRTNGKGWFLYGTRQLWTNVDFNMELFISEELDNDIFGATGNAGPLPDPWQDAVLFHDRIRLRTDISVRF